MLHTNYDCCDNYGHTGQNGCIWTNRMFTQYSIINDNRVKHLCKNSPNTIIYMDHVSNGIYEYDIYTDSNKSIKSWKSMEYHPADASSIYSQRRNMLYLIGGSIFAGTHYLFVG